MNLGDDFKKFAVDKGISSMNLHQYEASITPVILEQRELRATAVDIFSYLLSQRTLYLTGPVNQRMADIISAELLYLDSISSDDNRISMYLNTPGGSVPAGLTLVDSINYIKTPVDSINIGMCCSMGAVLLSAGAHRSTLPLSKVMIHMLSSQTGGHVMDQRISMLESEKYNYILFKILAENTKHDFYELIELARRDLWLDSQQALEFNIVDEIILNDKSKTINHYMEGFDEYYNKEVFNTNK